MYCSYIGEFNQEEARDKGLEARDFSGPDKMFWPLIVSYDR